MKRFRLNIGGKRGSFAMLKPDLVIDLKGKGRKAKGNSCDADVTDMAKNSPEEGVNLVPCSAGIRDGDCFKRDDALFKGLRGCGLGYVGVDLGRAHFIPH